MPLSKVRSIGQRGVARVLHGEDSVHFLCVVQAASIVSAAVFRSPLILKRDLEMLCGYDDRQLHQPYGTHIDDLKKKSARAL